MPIEWEPCRRRSYEDVANQLEALPLDSRPPAPPRRNLRLLSKPDSAGNSYVRYWDWRVLAGACFMPRLRSHPPTSPSMTHMKWKLGPTPVDHLKDAFWRETTFTCIMFSSLLRPFKRSICDAPRGVEVYEEGSVTGASMLQRHALGPGCKSRPPECRRCPRARYQRRRGQRCKDSSPQTWPAPKGLVPARH